ALLVPRSAGRTRSAGQVIVGGSASVTVTVKLPRAALPALSVAVQLTVVAPTGKAEPAAGWQPMRISPGKSSVAVTENRTTAVSRPGSVGTVMFAGTWMMGGVLSTTRNAITQLAPREPSLAANTTPCSPSV